MRLYWDIPRKQHFRHDKKYLFVEFDRFDKNVWFDFRNQTAEWCPSYNEILLILQELLRGKNG